MPLGLRLMLLVRLVLLVRLMMMVMLMIEGLSQWNAELMVHEGAAPMKLLF
jgi:hypothetical protein